VDRAEAGSRLAGAGLTIHSSPTQFADRPIFRYQADFESTSDQLLVGVLPALRTSASGLTMACRGRRAVHDFSLSAFSVRPAPLKLGR
jgi:hypothetical protein